MKATALRASIENTELRYALTYSYYSTSVNEDYFLKRLLVLVFRANWFI